MYIINTELKLCSICKKERKLDEFYSRNKKSKKKGNYIYYFPYCKDCAVEKSMQWREDNPEMAKISNKRYDMTEPRMRRNRERSRQRVESGWMLQWQRNNKDKLKVYGQQRWSNKKHNIPEQEWRRCKEYFNYKCAYCGLDEQSHKERYKQQLHKEHVIHEGRNDIKNCVPSCKPCNSGKHKYTLNKWYNEDNSDYTRERYLMIYYWLRWHCKDIK